MIIHQSKLVLVKNYFSPQFLFSAGLRTSSLICYRSDLSCWSGRVFSVVRLQVFGLLPHSTSNTTIAVATFIQSMAPLNSAANPLIYCLFSAKTGKLLRYWGFVIWWPPIKCYFLVPASHWAPAWERRATPPPVGRPTLRFSRAAAAPVTGGILMSCNQGQYQSKHLFSLTSLKVAHYMLQQQIGDKSLDYNSFSP